MLISSYISKKKLKIGICIEKIIILIAKTERREVTLILNKIDRIILFIRSCIIWFQSDQINRLIQNIKLFNVTLQFFISFSTILLYIFFSKLPGKIKSRAEELFSTTIDYDPRILIHKNPFRDYSLHIPAYQRNIVAEPYFFRI